MFVGQTAIEKNVTRVSDLTVRDLRNKLVWRIQCTDNNLFSFATVKSNIQGLRYVPTEVYHKFLISQSGNLANDGLNANVTPASLPLVIVRYSDDVNLDFVRVITPQCESFNMTPKNWAQNQDYRNENSSVTPRTYRLIWEREQNYRHWN